MAKTIPGIHHVTAIAGDPQRNVDFYVGLLGLRLVKKTVNFDDPGTYHLYFGDGQGSPGTIMTFFPWGATAPQGRIGDGQVTATAFSVPAGSLDYWKKRLKEHRIPYEEEPERFGDKVLLVRDPDGLQVELVFSEEEDARAPWAHFVPEEHAIRGFHHVTMHEEGYEATSDLLKDHLGFRDGSSDGARHRFLTGDGGPSAMVDVVVTPEIARGRVARGTVHHVAWRTKDTREQEEWRRELAEEGYNVTPLIDRNYFMSIYFREPGGVLFEIATDPPGFSIDEAAEKLGERLMLPRQYEHARKDLEARLPPIRFPEVTP